MNYELISEIAVLIVRVVVIVVMGYVVPKLKAYLDARLTAEQSAELERLIKALVEAAEQTIHTRGEDRKEYVVQQLKSLGYQVDEEIDARIEAAVYGLKEH